MSCLRPPYISLCQLLIVAGSLGLGIESGALPVQPQAYPTTAGDNVDVSTVIERANALMGSQGGGRNSNSPASQPAGAATAPEELETFPPPAVGQFTVYAISSGGGQVRCRQTIDAIAPPGGQPGGQPAPVEITVSEQTLINNQPVGKAAVLHLPRFGRRWPAPLRNDARTVSYTHEVIQVEAALAGQPAPAALDCLLLTIESRSAGVTRIEKEWICPRVPVTHIARLVVTTDGREVFRQELVDFGTGR